MWYSNKATTAQPAGILTVREETLFAEALEQATEAGRQAMLESACHGDAALRQRIERLLVSHQRLAGILDQGGAGDFLRSPLSAGQAFSASPALGSMIGPYQLKELLGEGGFGLVFSAEQQPPLHRHVALKLIKPGMDSGEIIARFKAERQALALMDHPHIATVYDAGTTEAGHPYFVMELVQGRAITEYCDLHQLTTQDRLTLFITVCQAVQHAHQKGIIHRDLKPGNVLVTELDGKPVVKVIDFGIAKALHKGQTEYSINTQVAQVMGTPAYMSPEQAEMSGLDVDTRSDIYSLGVLLYELLAGTTPFQRERLENASMDEIRRIIREEDPPRPSYRISTLGLVATTVSTNRRSDPGELSRLFRNELDWIVMKALEKDRERRYSSAANLARDVERYLHDEPVEASPPSSTYQLRKFLHRHRGAALAAATIFVLLAGGVIGTTLGMLRALEAEKAEAMRAEAESRERERAELAEIEAKASAHKAREMANVANQLVRFLRKDLLGQAGSAAQIGGLFTPNPNLTMREAMNRASARIGDSLKDQPEVEAAIRTTLGSSYHQLGQYEKAVVEFRRALEIRTTRQGPDDHEVLDIQQNLAQSLREAGRVKDAIKLFEHVRDIQLQRLGADHALTLITLNNLASAYYAAGRLTDALKLYEQVSVDRVKLLGADHPNTLCTLHNIGVIHLQAGRTAEAIKQLEQVRDAKIKILGPEHLDTLPTLSTLAVAYWKSKQLDKSIPLLEQLVPVYQKILGETHLESQRMLANLGVNYRDAGRIEDAIRLLKQSHHSSREFPSLRWTSRELLITYLQTSNQAAVPLIAEMVAVARTTVSPGSNELADILAQQGSTLLRLKAWKEAETLLSECVAIREKTSPQGWKTFNVLSLLGSAQLGQKKYAEAESMLLKGYLGFKEQEKALPPNGAMRLTESLDRLIQFYTETNKPEEVKKWEGEKEKAASPTGKP